MINNDVIRRIRYIENFSDDQMMAIFKLGGMDVSRSTLSQWLKKDEDPDFKNCSDKELATYLNGLISSKRGEREGEKPVPEKVLTNNIIFRKLTIAYNLRAEEVIEILQLADLRVGRPELSAFFRKPGHKNYRECKDQILRNFLMGLQIRLATSHE